MVALRSRSGGGKGGGSQYERREEERDKEHGFCVRVCLLIYEFLGLKERRALKYLRKHYQQDERFTDCRTPFYPLFFGVVLMHLVVYSRYSYSTPEVGARVRVWK